MKKQLKNSNVLAISNTLQVLGLRKGNIKERWKLALKSEHFLCKSELILSTQNQLIEEFGEVNEETGQKSLKVNEEHYVELMNCETDIEFEPILLEDVEEASMSELLILKDVIADA